MNSTANATTVWSTLMNLGAYKLLAVPLGLLLFWWMERRANER